MTPLPGEIAVLVILALAYKSWFPNVKVGYLNLISGKIPDEERVRISGQIPDVERAGYPDPDYNFNLDFRQSDWIYGPGAKFILLFRQSGNGSESD